MVGFSLENPRLLIGNIQSEIEAAWGFSRERRVPGVSRHSILRREKIKRNLPLFILEVLLVSFFFFKEKNILLVYLLIRFRNSFPKRTRFPGSRIFFTWFLVIHPGKKKKETFDSWSILWVEILMIDAIQLKVNLFSTIRFILKKNLIFRDRENALFSRCHVFAECRP